MAFRERANRPVAPLSVAASSTLGGYVGEWNFPPDFVTDRDPERSEGGPCPRPHQR